MTDSRKQPTSDPLAFPDGGADARLRSLQAQPAVAELKQRLRQLPDIEPDPAVWASIQNRAQPPTRPEASGGSAGQGGAHGPHGARRHFAPYAMAAGLLLAVTAGLLGVNVLRVGDAERLLQPNQAISLPVESAAIRALRERSRLLEPITQSFDTDPVASAFRYRIADVDAQLSSIPEGRVNQAEAQRLWGQRVALLESLAEVRRARAALQPAVY